MARYLKSTAVDRGSMVRRAHHRRAADHIVDAPEPAVTTWDTHSVAVVGIFGLMFFWVLYFARDILVPITFAFVLNLLLQPASKVLARLHVPKPLAALLTL